MGLEWRFCLFGTSFHFLQGTHLLTFLLPLWLGNQQLLHTLIPMLLSNFFLQSLTSKIVFVSWVFSSFCLLVSPIVFSCLLLSLVSLSNFRLDHQHVLATQRMGFGPQLLQYTKGWTNVNVDLHLFPQQFWLVAKSIHQSAWNYTYISRLELSFLSLFPLPFLLTYMPAQQQPYQDTKKQITHRSCGLSFSIF